MDGLVESYQDYPGLNFRPAFSRRACDALRDLLEPNGELLPLETGRGEYYFFNNMKVVDALDLKNSIIREGFDPPCTDAGIIYFAFHERRLKGLSIFRIIECPTMTIVTDQFVQRVHDAGLNGFDFAKIWPFPEGVKWHDETRKQVKLKQKKIDKLRKNVLIVALPLSGSSPRAAEKKKFAKLEKELEAQLLVPSLNAPVFGSYEGADNVNHELRILISCPDLDRLLTKLLPWLKGLDWGSKTYVVKRFGDRFDLDAREELVKLI